MVLELLAAIHLITHACHDVSLPVQVTPEGDCETIEHSATFTSCSFRDRHFTDRVNRFVERRLREVAQYDTQDGGENCESGETVRKRHVGAVCEALYQRGNVISFGCGSGWDSGVHPDGEQFAINLQITGRVFREIELKDVLVSDLGAAQLWKLVREDLQRQMETYCGHNAYQTKELEAERLAEGTDKYDGFHFSKVGIVITYRHSTFGYCIVESTIPYSRLVGVLKPSILRPPN
jgi:hypothetical protein